jgi:hypothetical protein
MPKFSMNFTIYNSICYIFCISSKMSQQHLRGGSSSWATLQLDDDNDLMINSQTRCSQSQDGDPDDMFNDG